MGQAAQLGQQGSDHGQYGQSPIVTPYGMNAGSNANQQQNENTQNVGDYSPMLPSGGLTQGEPKQWYPGMYPSTSPQFGTNPYAPQTFNVQGHPGHNPSTFAAVEPNINNSAMSNQGQFVQQMARGGSSNVKPANGGFTYTDSAKQWAGPVSTNAPSYKTEENPANAMMKGLGMQQHANPVNVGMGSAKGPGYMIGLRPNDPNSRNPELTKAFGKGPVEEAKVQEVTVPTTSTEAQVYKQTYPQYAPIQTNVDDYGNPLFNNGGSIRR